MTRQLSKVSVIFLWICSAFINTAHAQHYKVYLDSAKRFKVSIPETWTYIPNYKETFFLAHRPVRYKGESKIENLALSKIEDTSAKSLEEAFNFLLITNKSNDSTMQVSEQGTSKKGNYRWYISTHRNSKTSEIIKSMAMVYFFKNHPYILQCTASTLSFDKHKDIFVKIADSIQFM